MKVVPVIENAIVGSMATFPARFGILRQTVGSIASQLDRLYLYVNGTTEGLPDLSDLGDVVVLDGRDHAGDLLANGKVYPLDFVRKSRVFTLDDDFVFPPDYVAKNLALLHAFGGRCVVTTHGSILPPRADWYYERSVVFPAARNLKSLQICCIAGSGTTCFDQSTLRLDRDDLLREVMVDLKISLAAREASLPIFMLARSDGWLSAIKMDGLWERFTKGGLTPHTHLARTIDWSFDRYAEITRNAMAQAGVTPEQIGMDPELAACLESGDIPTHWQTTITSLQTRERYLKLLTDMADPP